MSRAVSEVLGYIYIFGIVMSVLAIVFVQVNTMVEDMKRSVMSQSLEQSFKKIQYIIHSVSFGEVPSQNVEIELQGGNLVLDTSSPEFIIGFVNYTNNNLDCDTPFQGINASLGCLNLSDGRFVEGSACQGSFNYSACVFESNAGKLKFQYKDWSVILEAGSVFSKYSGQDYSKLLFEPRIIYNATAGAKRFLVINIPELEGNLSLGGSGRFRFTVNEGRSNFSQIDVNDELTSQFNDVYIIIRDTENRQAWCNFFERNGEIFNTTLNQTYTGHTRCYSSENPTVTLELNRLNRIILIFREVSFSS